MIISDDFKFGVKKRVKESRAFFEYANNFCEVLIFRNIRALNIYLEKYLL